MKEIFNFMRFASDKELVDLFGSAYLDEIFDKYSEKYILKTIIDYLAES